MTCPHGWPDHGHGSCQDCQHDAAGWSDVVLPGVVLLLAVVVLVIAWWQR